MKKQASSTLITAALGLSILSWSSLFVWQGLDFTDMGFVLVAYQQFYTAPESNAYFLFNWLTCFIGHWLGEPFGGIVVIYKLAASFILAATGMLAYHGVRSAIGNGWPLAGFVFVTFLFATKSTANWVNYNNLTGLFYTLGAVMLFLGLIRERRFWIILAGTVLGANLFIRFPNLLGVGLVMAIVLHGRLQDWSARHILAWSGYYMLGWIFGLGLIAVMIIVHGHGNLYWQSLIGIFDKAVDDGSTHSGSMLINLFIHDHFYAAVLASLVIITGLVILRLSSGNRTTTQFTVVVVSAIILARVFHIFESWKWVVPGVLYFGLFWIALQEWRARPQVTLLSFLALMIMVLAPLGSGNGIRNALYGQWLSLPLVLFWLWQTQAHYRKLPLTQDPRLGKLASWTLVISLAGFSILTSYFYSYRDSQNRLAMRHALTHPLLQGTYTTVERAKVVNELLKELPKWVEPGDPLLAYTDLPTLHFLTQTRAWLENPWPILYREKKIRAKLSAKQREKASLPIVVRAMGRTQDRNWPVDTPRTESSGREAARQAFHQFVDENGYHSVWKNEFFEIMSKN